MYRAQQPINDCSQPIKGCRQLRKGRKRFLSLLILVSAALFIMPVFNATCGGAYGKGGQLIYSLSQNQTPVETLNSYGVPAYAMVGRARLRGTYLSVVRSTGFAYSSGLRSGDVLLSVNQRVTESPSVADKIIRDLSGVPLRVTFARGYGGGLAVRQINAMWKVAAENSMPMPGRITTGNYGSAGSSSSNQSVDDLEDYMFQLVNNDRTANGNLSSVRKSSSLGNLARAYAQDMAKRGFFSHSDPDGRNPVSRARQAGITGHIAENISTMRSSRGDNRYLVKGCQQDMMNEPPNQINHRGTILDPDQSSVGIGVAFSQRGIITVQEFSHDNIP